MYSDLNDDQFWSTVFWNIFGTLLEHFPLDFLTYLIAATENNAISMYYIKRVQFAPLNAKFCEKTVGTDHFRFSKFDSNLAGA